MGQVRSVLVVVLGVAVPGAAHALDGKVDVELGHQASVHGDGRISYDRGYAHVGVEAVLDADPQSSDSWEIAGAFRSVLGEGESEVSVRSLFVTRASEHTKLRIGFQDVSWGESLGFPVADLVNPRDLRDPLLLDPSWVRLPTFLANYQLTLGPVRLQAVVTPVPRNNLLPAADSPLSILPAQLRGIPIDGARPFTIDRRGADAEAGGRVSFLAGAGFDVSLLYLWHWNRRPVFEGEVTPAGPRLRVVQERVHSTGVGFSKAFESIVLRGDALLHVDEPRQRYEVGPARRGLHGEVAVGADYSSENLLVVGLQYQLDATADGTLSWVAAKVAKGFFDGKLQPEVFVFRGVGNSDTWVQPMLTWTFLERVSISARADFLWASQEPHAGILGPLDGVRRVMVWSKVRF